MSRKIEVGEIRGAKNQTLMRLIGTCENWARSGRPPGTKIVEYGGKLPKAGSDLLGEVETCRRNGREIVARRHSTECAPYLTAGVKKKCSAEFDTLDEIGRLDLTAMIEHGGNEIGWPKEQVRVQIYGSAEPIVGFVEIINIKAVLAVLVREQLVRAVDRGCADAGDDAHALDEKTRAERLATISSDLLFCERTEAALVWIAKEQGFPIQHRETIDVRALLNVDCVVTKTPPPSDNGSHVTKYVGVAR